MLRETPYGIRGLKHIEIMIRQQLHKLKVVIHTKAMVSYIEIKRLKEMKMLNAQLIGMEI